MRKWLVVLVACVIFFGLAQAGIIGQWDFETGSGTTAYDISGNGNHATLGGPANVAAGGTGVLGVPTWSSDTPEGSSCSLFFDEGLETWGDGQGAVVYNNASLASLEGVGNNAITIEADVKINTYRLNAGIIDKGVYKLYLAGTNAVRFQIDICDSAGTDLGFTVVDSAVAAPVGTWFNIKVTYDGINVNLYFDDVLQGTASAPEGSAGIRRYVTPRDLIFGSANLNANGEFDGYIDNVAISNVPEPATLLVFGSGAALLGLRRRRSQN